MPSAVDIREDGPAPKRQKVSAHDRPKTANASRIFAPYRTVGLVSPTDVPFTSVPLGKTTFQITTSTGRTLHTYDLRRGLQLVFITRPQTPAQISATISWKDLVFAAYGTGAKQDQGVWIYKRGRKIAELEQPGARPTSPITRLHIFGTWLIGVSSDCVQVWKTGSWEHYTTIQVAAATGPTGTRVRFSGAVCSVPTLLNKILLGKSDGSVDIWNVNTGRLVYTIQPKHNQTGEVTALAPSPALGLVGIARATGKIAIHDVRRDTTVLKLEASGKVSSISFRTDGQGAGKDGQQEGIMVTAGEESGDATIWDLNDGGRVVGVLRNAHNPPSGSGSVTGGISKVEFLSGQRVLITSGRDNSLKTWVFDESPVSTIPRILHSRSGHAAPVSSLQFLPAESDGADAIGKWLLSAGRDRSLWGWSLRRDGQSTEISQGNIRKKAKKLGFNGQNLDMETSSTLEDLKAPEITSIACNLNRDGGMGASTGGGAVWANVTTKKTDPNAPVTGWESMVTAHKGDKYARTWFWGRKKAGRWAFETSDGTEVKSVAMSPCGTFALVGSAGGSIDMFNLQSGFHRRKFPAPLTPAQAKHLKLRRAQIAEDADAPELTPDELKLGRGKHARDVTGIVVDNMNRTVISSGLDGKIKFWDFMTGTLQYEVDWHPMTAIIGSRFHRSSELLALSCDDLSIRVIDIETRKLVREFWGCVGQIKDFSFSNDGRWIVAASMDSMLRVWDLPTGHLIDVVKLDSVCTALAFSPTGEFLATAHADSIGVSVWSNRALFKHVSTRQVQEDDASQIALPSESGEGAQSLLAAAFEEDDETPVDGENAGASSTVDQLSSEMTTLSIIPRSRWQTLLHIDLITARNKPIEAPKAPEKAPFFLPSLEKSKNPSGSTPSGAGPSQDDTAALTITPAERSRISALQKRSTERPFTALLHAAAAGDHEPFVAHMKTLPPAAADIEIRSLKPDGVIDELAAFVKALAARLQQRRDYEVVQAWMAVFLKIHGQVAVGSDECREELRRWKEVHQEEQERIGGLVGYCGGVVSFLRSARA